MEGMIRAHLQRFADPAARLGAHYVPGAGTYIRLWAPYARTMEIEWLEGGRAPLDREHDGYFTGFFPAARPGDRYVFVFDGQEKMADPASRYQPEGTLGPSMVVAADYPWRAEWRGLPFREWNIYEIHVGTFSPRHDFTAVTEDLDRLKRLGVTVLEIMPVSQFSGARNWGYDGVFPHAVQNSYGGPEGFKALIDAAHERGLAVILDVVHNHIGPEGNVLFRCGPYTQDKYRTPWGAALNFDGADSDHVRRYFLQSVWQWLTEYRLDGLRLDAVQTIFDTAPVSYLEELTALKDAIAAQEGRDIVLIAETDMNDSRLLRERAENGIGMDAHWADDLHHALHATLTGERDGYYRDYGGAAQIARIYRRGVAYDGCYSPYRRRHHGRSYQGIEKNRLVVQTQNHDQVGNRLFGERLSQLVDFERLKLAAGCVLLSPFTPLLFMGEEFAAETPFLYFVSHEDPALLEAVRKGRREEWKDFDWRHEPPDPAAPASFEQCVLAEKDFSPPGRAAAMQEYYQRLLALSRRLRKMPEPAVEYEEAAERIILRYRAAQETFTAILSFAAADGQFRLDDAFPQTECLVQSSWFTAEAEAYRDKHVIDDVLEIPAFSATIIRGYQ